MNRLFRMVVGKAEIVALHKGLDWNTQRGKRQWLSVNRIRHFTRWLSKIWGLCRRRWL
jgi:hypothetical protein